MNRIRRRKPRYPTEAQLAERREWAEAFNRCWVCWRVSRGLNVPPVEFETHEIASRSQAASKWADKRNYLRTCARCHDEVLSWIPEVVQLALKKIHDPNHYDRVFINRIRSRADDAIDEGTVRAWERFIRICR